MAEDMTRVLWEMLPEQYRRHDADATPGFPLLRWLEGPGHILTRVRGFMDVATDGGLIDADRTPDQAVMWLGMLVGLNTRNLSVADVRKAVSARVASGAPAVGTREHISRVAMYVLGSDVPLLVMPDNRRPWIIYVLSDSASIAAAGGVNRVRERIEAYGATPAGHVIAPVVVRASWDNLDTAKGVSWNDFMDKVRTWLDYESLGVSFDDVTF